MKLPFVPMPPQPKKRALRAWEAPAVLSARPVVHLQNGLRTGFTIQVIMRRPESIQTLPVNRRTISMLPDWCSDFQARWLTGLSESELGDLRLQFPFPIEQEPTWPMFTSGWRRCFLIATGWIYHTKTISAYARYC